MPLFPENEGENPGSGDAMAQSARAGCDGVSRKGCLGIAVAVRPDNGFRCSE